MMSNVRNTGLCLLCLLLTACSFSPLYGTSTARQQPNVQEAFNQIYIEVIPNREGQILRNSLMDRFYTQGRPGANATYALRFSPVAERRTDLDITKSADATRAQLRLRTQMRLIDKQTGDIVLQRELTAITSYNILQSQFTTRVTEDNARTNALEELARQAERHLALYFSR